MMRARTCANCSTRQRKAWAMPEEKEGMSKLVLSFTVTALLALNPGIASSAAAVTAKADA